MSARGWVGVDLDGTLAHYEKWVAPDHIGEPIAPMLERVKRWLAEGREVRIFTARVSHDHTPQRMEEARLARHAIADWCERHIGRVIPITNIKDYACVCIYDDRARQVEANTGRVIGEEGAA